MNLHKDAKECTDKGKDCSDEEARAILEKYMHKQSFIDTLVIQASLLADTDAPTMQIFLGPALGSPL